MTKREVLVAICENPGWQPPTDPPSSVERALDELLSEGWIMSRLDGWEASAKALEQYPRFLEQEDIADPLGAGAKTEAVMKESPATTMSYTAKIGPRQQVTQEVQFSSVKGSVALANHATGAETYEAEVTIKVRRV